MSSAREEILASVRRHTDQQSKREADYRSIGRGYRVTGQLNGEERLLLFIDRLEDYGCEVHRASEAELAKAIGLVLRARGKNSLLTPPGLPPAWLPQEYRFEDGTKLTYHELDRTEGVLTGCKVAIAATGTILLVHSAGEGGRALTLIPDYHLCVVFEEQVVETVPEALREIGALAAFPLTTISGPSATADIEMTRIKGVHGPRTLEVILVAR